MSQTMINRKQRLTARLAALTGQPMTIPSGTVLFHGTIEDFKDDQLKASSGGASEGILWLSDDSLISQTYIPVAGSTLYAPPRSILYPSKEPLIQKLQKQLGIDYHRLDETEWDHTDRPLSYWPARGWMAEHPYTDSQKVKDELKRRMQDLGYTRERDDDWAAWQIHQDRDGNPQPPSFRETGRLFIITVNQPLKIFDFTYGGRTEGDLMNLDYHRYKDFDMVAADGYDGFKINDFAQSEDYGNVNHTSIGVFGRTLKKLSWEVIPAKHQNLEPYWSKRVYESPEYQAYKERLSK